MTENGREPFVQFTFLLPDAASTNKKVNDRFGKRTGAVDFELGV